MHTKLHSIHEWLVELQLMLGRDGIMSRRKERRLLKQLMARQLLADFDALERGETAM